MDPATASFSRTGLFSQYSAYPWNNFSWIYQALLAGSYKIFGLRAIVIVLMAFKVAFAVVTYRLAKVAGADLWVAILLSAVAQYVVPDLQPESSSLSMLFFGIELLLLVQSRRTGHVRRLFWLPPLFLLWANVDVRAVIGLFLLILFLAALACEDAWRGLGMSFLQNRYELLPLKRVSGIVAASVVCTLLNPYSFRIFSDFARDLYSSTGFQYFGEMRAMSFRHPHEYLLMLFVMTAFLAMGRRRSLEAFELFALVAGTLLAFRVQRDAWLAVLTAVTVIASGFSPQQQPAEPGQTGKWQTPLTATLVMGIFLIAGLCLRSNTALLSQVGQSYPVRACDYIAKNHLPQPLFNTYSWGGFSTWYLPDYPVSVDSRVDLYGDKILGRYFELVGGKARLDGDPTFARARTLLLERQSGMTKALSDIPALSSQYRLVYSDDVAAVFVRQ